MAFDAISSRCYLRKVDPLKADGQVELLRNLQIATALIDSTGLCLFVAFAVLDKPEAFNAIVDMVNAKYGSGQALSEDDTLSVFPLIGGG